MKKILLFAGSTYYPSGGMDDFVRDFNSIEEAKSFINNKENFKRYDWWQIVDRDTLQVIEKD